MAFFKRPQRPSKKTSEEKSQITSLGPKTRIEGTLDAESATVEGRFTGEIHAHHLHVGSTGEIQGKLRYQKLQIEAGGVIIGESHHESGSNQPRKP